MSSVRWRKVLNDLWLHKSRTALAALAISVGIVGAGAVLDTWSLVRNGTRSEFTSSEPASATVRTTSVEAALMDEIRRLPSIRFAEARSVTSASALTSTGWRPALLMSAPDFSSVRIGVIKPEQGTWPPRDGQVAIESSSLDFAGVAVGDRLPIRIGNGDVVELPVSAVARDVGLAPGWMEHIVYTLVTPATLAQLGGSAAMSEVRIVVIDRSISREQVREVAQEVKGVIEASGRTVSDIEVPIPGRHIHAAQIDSLLFTQGAFGALALLLSGFLVVNLVSAMLAGQVREIGVMKALGASPAQIAGMYSILTLVIGAAASVVAIPIAFVIGKRYAEFTASLLNFDVSAARVPAWVIVTQLAVGLVLPLVASAIPVWRGSTMPVTDAVNDFGIREKRGGKEVALQRFSGFARPVLLSLRNAFRRRARMILTLVTLAVGGAVYLGAINLRQSVIDSVDTLFGSQRFDMVLRFAEPHAVDSIESIVSSVTGVARAEAWSGARAAVKRRDGTVGNAFPVTAMPAASVMMLPSIRTGRWLKSGDGNDIVVNQRLIDEEPALSVGSTVTLVIKGGETSWRIVGVSDSNPSPIAYAPRETIAPLVAGGRASAVVVASSLKSPASEFDVMQRLRTTLEDNGFAIQSGQLMREQRTVVEDHLLMVAGFLGIMAKLIIIVGGLGLASTLSMGVLERTREIGVMRAVGARNLWIAGIILIEGLVISTASWLAAIPLSIPMSAILARAFGRIMFSVPVTFLSPADGLLRWLAVVTLVAIAACAWPALRAMRIPTARALAYE